MHSFGGVIVERYVFSGDCPKSTRNTKERGVIKSTNLYTTLLIKDEDKNDFDDDAKTNNNNQIITLEELLLSTKKKTKNTALHIAAFSGEVQFCKRVWKL